MVQHGSAMPCLYARTRGVSRVAQEPGHSEVSELLLRLLTQRGPTQCYRFLPMGAMLEANLAEKVTR